MTRLLPLLVALLGACSEPSTGPAPIRFDRDTCERCRMTISHPRFATQVRLLDSGQVRSFDDLGCAVIWLEDSGAQFSEIWVRNRHSSDWMDARQAYYEPVKGTPMDYGWGAVGEPGEQRLGFEQVRERIRANRRPGHEHGSATR